MSELKVNTIESNNTLTANSLTVGNTTINATGITAPTYVINTSAVAIGNSSANVIITANSSVNFVVVNNAPNVFPSPLDIYSWASQASSFNNCGGYVDTTVPVSPAGGSQFKIVPTGPDPFFSTYNSNTWNLATTANGDIWKVSGYVRANGDITLAAAQFLLPLPANSSGNYGTAGIANAFPSATLIGNTWTYFEKIFQINGNANTAYIQIRPDGPDSGLNDFWYDGLSLQRVLSNNSLSTIPETVNTQIFTANGTWTKPSWATDGKELVIVHMWGGGGGAFPNNGGGGGAFVYGYFISSQCNSTCNVVVGLGGLAQITAGSNGQPGGTSVFYANTTNSLSAYGGGGGKVGSTGGGGGWFSTGSSPGAGGSPLGGAAGGTGGDSTFGGGGGFSTTPYIGGNSIYGGGGGSNGSSIFGGGGGGSGPTNNGKSIYGGQGGITAPNTATIPGGGGGNGGGSAYDGSRGEVRVYTLRIVS